MLPSGESVEELKEDINYFLHAFKQPVLEEKVINGKQRLDEIKEDKQ